MNWQEYTQLAIRTESVPVNLFEMVENDSKATRLLHAALGVCTEVAELIDGHTIVNKLEELGDILWYLAIADEVLDWHSEHYHADMMKPVMFYIGEVQDVIKRHIFYGKELDEVRLGRSFSAILEHVTVDLEMSGLPLEDCYRANIMKLEKRYPEKFFDAKAAIHRDVDRELEHISETGEVLAGIDALLDQATVESDIILRWKQITSEGIELDNLSPEEVDDLFLKPQAVKARILAWLGCPVDQATELLGTAFTHSEIRSCSMGDGKFHLKVIPYELVEEVMDKETILETFFPTNQVLLSFQGFNDLVRSLLTLGQIEQMAMDLAFTRAEQYRKMGAFELARGYDALYKTYSGKGDRLEDFSLAILWQEAGYSMDEVQVKERLERWK